MVGYMSSALRRGVYTDFVSVPPRARFVGGAVSGVNRASEFIRNDKLPADSSVKPKVKHNDLPVSKSVIIRTPSV